MLFDCPHCKAKCQFDSLDGQRRCRADESHQQGWLCLNCNGIIITKFTVPQNLNTALIFPLIKINPKIDIKKLDDKFKNDYLEALEDYSNGCYVSCVIMCRRVIQQSCIDKGAKKKK